MRTLLALVLSPLAAAVALLVVAPTLMLLRVGDGPRHMFWSTLPAVVIVGTAISYAVTLVIGTLTHFVLWARDRTGFRDYLIAGLLLGAGAPVALIALDGFNARVEDAFALAVLGAAAGGATAAAFWRLAVRTVV